jgi:hypothetical protein
MADELEDLLERLTQAEKSLHDLAGEYWARKEHIRLLGKREGVGLARSYVEEMIRQRPPEIPVTHTHKVVPEEEHPRMHCPGCNTAWCKKCQAYGDHLSNWPHPRPEKES